MRIGLKLIFCAVCAVFVAAGALSAQAPAPSGAGRIIVHELQYRDDVLDTGSKTPGRAVTINFSVQDGNGSILHKEITAAKLKIGDTPLYQNNVVQLEKRWALVILLDGSLAFGSQPRLYDIVRNNLIAALGAAPEGASIELMAFDDTAFTLPGATFTENKEALSKALIAFRPKTASKICQNEGLYSAVRRLGAIGSGTLIQRRGVLLLTGSTDNCATRTVRQVLDEAETSRGGQVAIYAVGIDGSGADKKSLEAFTKDTNGLTLITGADTSNISLGTVMQAIAKQYETGFTVFLPAGKTKARLTLLFKDGNSVSDDLVLESEKAYEQPVDLRVLGAQRTPAGVRASISYRNSASVKSVQILVMDKGVGRAIDSANCNTEQMGIEPLDLVFCPFKFEDGEYAIRAIAKNSNGVKVSESTDFDIKNQLKPGSMNIEKLLVPAADPDAITITLGRINLDGIDRYQVELLDQQGGGVASSKVESAPGARPIITKVGRNTPDGDYKLRITALDSQNKPIPDIPPVESRDPIKIHWRNFWEKSWEDVRGNPWTFAIAAVALLLSVSGMYAIVRLLRTRAYIRSKAVELVLPEVVRKAAPKNSSRSYEPLIAEAPSHSQAGKTPQAAPQAAISLPSLVVIAPPEVRFSTPLNQSPFTVGRKDGGDSAALPVDHTYGVSRNHIALVKTDGAWFVRDDRSSNGTTLNGKPLARGKLVKLSPNDTLGLGPKVKMRFKMPGA